MRIDQHHFRWLPGEAPGAFEAAVAIELGGRWWRAGAFWGEAPGSHMIGKHATAWRTRLGSFHGWNARLGWWPRPCLTLLLHTRPVRS